MSIFNEFNKKEKPVFTGITRGVGGFGFGSGGAGGDASGGPQTFTIYLWGAGADQKDDAGLSDIKAGFTEVTVTKASIPGSYSRFEIIVGERGYTDNQTTRKFGGGGGGSPNSGTPGGGGSFAFLSSPTASSVFSTDGHSLNIPSGNADPRCVAAAGGMGGRDTVDNAASGAGGGLEVPNNYGYTPEKTKVDRSNSNPAYIGANGTPGSPYSSGGGGGGYAAGLSQYDYPGWGGTGFAGSENVSVTQPFTGPSPVNSLSYTLGNTIRNNPVTTGWTAPTGAAPYRPADAAKPSHHVPAADSNGYVVVIDDATGTATEFAYTGTIQYYNFP